MSEITAVGYLCKGLERVRKAHCIKHNDLTVGIADVSAHVLHAGTQWIEVKATQEWPKREETRIWWPHFTEHQALFLRRREGWLFVRVERDYFLFSAAWSWELWMQKGFPQSRMREVARAHWARSVNFPELGRILWG
jgi:hypothetical protein